MAVFREKMIKVYGYQKIYQQLVKDLLVLEAGIEVNFPSRRTVKCGLLIHPADNLEAHGVGGFSQSFSSKDICRFCHIQHCDLLDNIHDYGARQHAAWTHDDYDRATSKIKHNKDSETMHDLVEPDILESDAGSSSNEDSSDSDDSEGCLSTGSDDDNIESYGVKHICPLNKLQAFHSVEGFPPGKVVISFLNDYGYYRKLDPPQN